MKHLLDADGLLLPGCHTCLAIDLFDLFVDPFPGTNRDQLFFQWQTYNARLRSFTDAFSLVQWIGGSFISKKPNPADIDFVTFIPYADYERLTEPLIDFYSTSSLYEIGLDAYTCSVYPAGHPQFGLFDERQNYWQELFGSRKDDSRQRGFVKITL